MRAVPGIVEQKDMTMDTSPRPQQEQHMTDEEMDKIDAMVAEKVMGVTPSAPWCRCDKRHESREYCMACGFPCPSEYTRSGDAMLMVVEKMREEGWRVAFAVDGTDPYECGFGRKENMEAGSYETANTAPLAVCLAALAAVGHPYQPGNKISATAFSPDRRLSR